MKSRSRNLLTTGLLCASVFALIAAAASSAVVGPLSPAADGTAAFERLKTLQGTWRTTESGDRKAFTVFELTANGTVLLERYANPSLPGGGQMVTAYYLDGRDLVLTHYCIARNQPTLRAEQYDAASGEVQFEFVRATNLPNPDAGHMRRARYRIQDADRFTTEWEFFEGGRKKMTEVETFARVK